MTTPTEPTIIINGVELTQGQAMTLRVAVESFSMDMYHNGLGNDDMGKALAKGYLHCIEGIRKAMYRR